MSAKNRDKFLTLMQGNCWHDWLRDGDVYWDEYSYGDKTDYKCSLCGDIREDESVEYPPCNDTFDGAYDFFHLFEWAKGELWWMDFVYEISNWTPTGNLINALPIEYVNPTKFSDSIYIFLLKNSTKMKKVKMEEYTKQLEKIKQDIEELMSIGFELKENLSLVDNEIFKIDGSMISELDDFVKTLQETTKTLKNIKE